jgi:hypothetical protein
MTPKEKAKELVKKFMSIDSDSEKFDGFKMGFFYAQRCALIAVDEIINGYEFDILYIEHKRIMDNINFWDEVKKEIEKL